MKFFAILLTFLLCILNINYAICSKCDFEQLYSYTCKIKPDSSSINEKHDDAKTDNDVETTEFDGNDNEDLFQLDLSPFCQRFKNMAEVNVNNVKFISENSFQKCKNLKEIWIEDAEMEEIPENLFSNQSNLIQIIFKNGKLKAIPENTFKNQKKLEHLNLEINKISCLPPNIFKSLIKLTKLNLRENKIQSLNPKWFENLHSLRTLWLNINKIRDLPKNVFVNLKNLNKLYLNDNQLTALHSDSFGIHRYLEIIGLKNNRIDAIDERIINNSAVKKLDMIGNVCSTEDIERSDKLKEKLSNCFKNYQPSDQPREQSTCSSASDNTSGIKCGTRHLVKQLIYGGTVTIHGEYPWNVALTTSNGDFFCGGSLVSNRHVVTAAHCIKGKRDSHKFGPNDFSVLLGVHNHSKPDEVGRISVNVAQINVNPIWNTEVNSYDGDIAVLELANEVQFNSHIRPICLADENTEVGQSSKGTVVGFGHNENGTISHIANKLEVPIRSYHSCTSYSRDHHSYISFRTFCGGPADGRSVCAGDSGGGVYVQHNFRFYLRGLVSASLMNAMNQCDVHREAIFTDVTKYYDWIERIVRTAPKARLVVQSTTAATTTTSRSYSVPSRSTMRYAFGGPVWD